MPNRALLILRCLKLVTFLAVLGRTGMVCLAITVLRGADLSPRHFGKNEPDCEPVHMCSAWRLLASYRWGFQGQ
jgi:hypothetical protein